MKERRRFILYKKSMILNKSTYKTGEVAALLGVSIQTVINYCEMGHIPFYKTEHGHRRILAEDVYNYLVSLNMAYDENSNSNDTNSTYTKSDVIYARVSTHKQAERGDLEQQVEKVMLYEIHQNVNNLIVKTDIASGLDDNRKNLLSLIDMVQKGEVSRIFVLDKDRLTSFGYPYLKKICDFHGVSIIVVLDEIDIKTQSEELAEDIITLIHSFSEKLYDLRQKIKKEIKCNEES